MKPSAPLEWRMWRKYTRSTPQMTAEFFQFESNNKGIPTINLKRNLTDSRALTRYNRWYICARPKAQSRLRRETTAL